LYLYTPEVESIQNSEVIYTTSGKLDQWRARQVLADSPRLETVVSDYFTDRLQVRSSHLAEI